MSGQGKGRMKRSIGAATTLGGVILTLALLSGCASSRLAIDLSPGEWEAELAKRGVDPKKAPHPMLATPGIRELASRTGGGGAQKDQLRRMQLALMDRENYTFEYEGLSTHSAAETFERRRGNCVSFTNLFIALGRSLNIPLQAGLLVRRGQSTREGDLVVVYGHMVAVLPGGKSATIYDFYQRREETGGGVVLVDDLAVAAISASNWAVHFLRKGELEQAEGSAETAVRLAPDMPDVWGNLGLVRWRKGDRDGAFAAFRSGLRIDSQKPSLLNNIAGLYLEMGRPEDARTALAAANYGYASPYFFIAYGDVEFARGNFKDALRYYKRAHRLDPKIAEPLLAVSRAESALGDEAAARKALEKASKLKPKEPVIQLPGQF